MIASARGLAVLACVALALILALVLDEPPTPPPSGPRTVVHDVPARAVQIVIDRVGEGTQVLDRERDTWVLAGSQVRVEPATVAALLDTLRIATWHRRGGATAAGAIRGSVRVLAEAGAMSTGATVQIGQELPGAPQTWILVERTAYLVDSWIVRAIWPSDLALRVRHPLAAAEDDVAIGIDGLRLHHGRRTEPTPPLWLDPGRVRALVAALAELEVVSLPPAPAAPAMLAGSAVVTLETAPTPTVVRVAGACPEDRLRVTSVTMGDGCVEREAWARIEEAAAALEGPRPEIADRRPVPFSPGQVTLADGTVVDLAGLPRVAQDEADPARIAELRAALTTPAELASIAEAPRSKTPGVVIAKGPAGVPDVRLELRAGGTLSRDDGVALRVSAEAWRVLTRPAVALRDPVLWREDALTITSIALGQVTYRRGAVIGEWVREPATTPIAPDVAALVDAVSLAVAIVRAPSAAAPTRIGHAVTVTFSPPTGAPITHRLEIGVPTAEGCAARVDGRPVRIDLPLCTAVHALAATH